MQSTGSSVGGWSGVETDGEGDEVVAGAVVVVAGGAVVVGGAVAVVDGAVELVVRVVELVVVVGRGLEVDVVDAVGVAVVVELEELRLVDSGGLSLHADRASPATAMAVTATIWKLLFIVPPLMTTLSRD